MKKNSERKKKKQTKRKLASAIDILQSTVVAIRRRRRRGTKRARKREEKSVINSWHSDRCDFFFLLFRSQLRIEDEIKSYGRVQSTRQWKNQHSIIGNLNRSQHLPVMCQTSIKRLSIVVQFQTKKVKVNFFDERNKNFRTKTRNHRIQTNAIRSTIFIFSSFLPPVRLILNLFDCI